MGGGPKDPLGNPHPSSFLETSCLRNDQGRKPIEIFMESVVPETVRCFESAATHQRTERIYDSNSKIQKDIAYQEALGGEQRAQQKGLEMDENGMNFISTLPGWFKKA